MLSSVANFLISLILPSLYVTALVITYNLFQKYNTLRLQSKTIKHTTQPYFGRNMPKEIYLELSEQYSPETEEGRKVLGAALLKRAVQDVQRILKIREEKGPLVNLVKSGCVGEDLLENMQTAELELNQECEDVANEAELVRKGWKKSIFQEAAQIANMLAQKERDGVLNAPPDLEDIQAEDAEAQQEKEVEVIDEKRRLEIEQELVREEEREKQRERQKSQAAEKKKKNKKK